MRQPRQGPCQLYTALLCAIGLVVAILPVPDVSADGRWRFFSVPDDPDPQQNLLSTDIRALAADVDERGIPQMWIGTDRGLQLYDGREWRDWTLPQSKTDNTEVTALLIDSANSSYWVGTEHGLNWTTAEQTWENTLLDGSTISALASDKAGGAYVGTLGGHLWYCLPTTGACQERASDLAPVRALLYLEDTLWIGSQDGLGEMQDDTFRFHTTADGLLDNRIVALAADSQGRLWIGTETGISRYDAATSDKWTSFSDPRQIRSLDVDDRDRVWAATDRGLFKWDPRWETRQEIPTQWQYLGVDSGDLRDDSVSLVYAQPQGALWVVTESGLSVMDGSWETYRTEQMAPGVSLLINQIYALHQEEQTGDLWVGTNAGVSHYDASTAEWDQFWSTADGLKGEIHALTQDAESGTVWAGTSSGVHVWTPEQRKWQFLGSSADDLGKEQVWALAHDPERGQLWAGTEDGLIAYSATENRWRRIWPEPDGRGGQAVYRLALDPQRQVLWAMTDEHVVLYRLQSGQFEQNWLFNDQVPVQPMHCLLLDSARNIVWVGMQDRILSYLDGTWSVDGDTTPGDVYDLALDTQPDVLWAATSEGVYRYDRNTGRWDLASRGVSGINTGETHTVAAGGPAGDVWVASNAAVARLSLSTDTHRPWVALSLALVEGQNALRENTVKLLDVYSPVEFQFRGGSLVSELGNLHYHYQLEGIDESSRLTTPDQGLQATYPELPYGKHTFVLWTQDELGRRSEAVRYPVHVQARPRVTLVQVLGSEVDPEQETPPTVDQGQAIPIVVAWADPDSQAQPTLQAGWFDPIAKQAYTVQTGDTLSKIAEQYDQGMWQIAQYNGIADPNLIVSGQEILIPPADLPDTVCPGQDAVANCWTPLETAQEIPGQLVGSVRAIAREGTYQLLVRAIDGDGNASLPNRPVSFAVRTSRDLLPWAGLLGGILIVVVAGYTLRRYPDYASNWGEAYGYPIQQLIPLVAPLNDPLDVPRVQSALQGRQAFTTTDQVQSALEELVHRRILMHAEGGGYLFVDPFVAWLHRLRAMGRRDSLAEAVRSRHPLYAGARSFFDQSGFEISDLSPEALLLTPRSDAHPQASYGEIYVLLAAGRALEGDDFEDVGSAAQAVYDGELEHRLAFVVLNQRPTPGARLRLYEIRQSLGLAIVTLDSELFRQVKPNMPAGDILTAQIDQATGRQDLYAISGPVSDDLGFFGRETILQQLIDLVDAGQPVGVFGLRKTGKTSVLRRLQGRLATRRVIASLDLQGTTREHGILSLYPAIISGFVAHIQQYRPGLARSAPALRLWPDYRTRTLSPEISRLFDDDLHDIHEWIGGDERLLLILDEIDRLLPAGEDTGYEGFSTFLGQIRAANQGLEVLDFIVAGVDPGINRRDKWGARDNELYQALREVWMPAMRQEAIGEMIETMGFQMGIQYERAALDRIAHAGGGQPFLTRQICSQVVRDLLDRSTWQVTAAQAAQGIEDYVYLPDSYLTELWRTRLDKIQRALLVRLAQTEAPIPRAELLPAERRQDALSTLGRLEERTIVRRENGGYLLGWPILRNWIRWIELGLSD